MFTNGIHALVSPLGVRAFWGYISKRGAVTHSKGVHRFFGSDAGKRTEAPHRPAVPIGGILY